VPVRNSEQGFSLVEVLIGLAVTAALLALIVDLLAADSLQSRRFMSRSEAAVGQLQARRIFLSEAARATGLANARELGALRILPGALVLQRDGMPQTILRWEAGRASFSYRKDGSSWRGTSYDADSDIARFTLQQGGLSRVWIAP
jgi:prepilin-type N-terminal cleavage/methylation domain-containing protein